jgi:nucleoside-diphosphate-sugar epimerase
MSKGLVLVTGANGYIAARTVEAFLIAGYSVRGTVRSLKSATPVQEALASYGDKLSFVAVPDITAPDAFDEAVKGVDAVAHLAAPVSMFFTDPEPVIKTAKTATWGILESATKEPSVKHFVLMSSITAVRGMKDGPYTFTEGDWNDFAVDLVEKMGKTTPGPVIYSASKVEAEKIFWKFRDERKPNFTMTAVNPSFVAGPPLVAPESPEKLGETYEFLWKIFAGGELTSLAPGFDWYVDVRDVGKLVVYGVEHGKEANNERFIASSSYGPPQAVADILLASYPDRRSIIQEGKTGEGYLPGYKAPIEQVIDGTKATRAMGVEYIPFDKLVLDTVKLFEKW